MEQEKNNKGIIILLAVLVVILTILCVLFATGTINSKSNEVNNNSQTNNENINNTESQPIQGELGENDTFSTTTNSGVVEVIGYPEVKELVDEMYTGEKYNYVYFYVTKTKSTEFKKYLDSLAGNSFVSNNSIGLGCSKDGIITYYNSSDQLGDKEYKLSQADSNKILQATESNPVKLKLERLLYTSGKGAPSCYSHITKIEVEN